MADRIWIPVNRPNSRTSASAGESAGGSSGGGASGTSPKAEEPRREQAGTQSTAEAGQAAAGQAGAERAAAEQATAAETAARAQEQTACPDELQAALLEAEAKRDEYLDQLLRLKAEFENYRKRVRREVEEASFQATASLLTQFLPVLDNLERALAAAEHHEEGKVLTGVRMTESQFLDLLRRHGVEQIDPIGQPFDPELHDALLSQPSSEPEGIVTAVMEKGYKLGDRIVRPARVAVSAGPAGNAGE